MVEREAVKIFSAPIDKIESLEKEVSDWISGKINNDSIAERKLSMADGKVVVAIFYTYKV